MQVLLIAILGFTVTFKGPEDFKIRETKSGYQRILAPHYNISSKPGEPMLPSRPIFFAIPENEKVVGMKIINASYRTLPGKYRIEPVPEPSILPIAGKIVFKAKEAQPDKSIYRSSKAFPESPLEFKGNGNFSGFRVASFILHPFRYYPASGRLEVLKELTVEIETGSFYGKRKVKKRRIGYEIILNALKKLVENPENIDTSGIEIKDEGFDYLIVTEGTFVPAFDSLANWYNKFGLKTRIRTISWIENHYYGRDLAEKLRNYLKACYQDSGLTFVLLAGDVEYVPDRVAYAMTSGAGYYNDEDSLRADLYFSDLDGTWDLNNNGIFGEVSDSVDLYPDVFVGRAPVRNLNEAWTFVHKVIAYEYPAPENRDYQNKALFFAEILWYNPYTDASLGKEMIDSLFVPENIEITKLYESLGNENSSQVVAQWNLGKNLSNHDGHGFYSLMGTGEDYLWTEDVDNLNNGDRLGILFSIGCWVGAFDYDAISEHFIRNPNGGGVAFIGNSRYGWGSPGNPGYGYSDRFDAEFYDMLFTYKINNIGLALALDKMLFIPYSQDENVYRWHEYQVNLLGDPVMPVWLDIPREIVAHIPDTVFAGEPFYLSFENIQNGRLTITRENQIILLKRFEHSGLRIHLPDSLTGSFVLTVYSQGFLPLIKK